MLVSGTLLLCAAIVFLFFWLDRRNSKRLDGPPGPTPWPVLGNLPLLASLGSMSRGFFELSQKYGPIMSIWLGPQRFVVVTSPEMAQEVLRAQDHATASRQVRQCGRWATLIGRLWLLGMMVAGASGEE